MDRFPSQSSAVPFYCMFCAHQLTISSVRKLKCSQCHLELPEQCAEVVMKWLSTTKPEAVKLIKDEPAKPEWRKQRQGARGVRII